MQAFGLGAKSIRRPGATRSGAGAVPAPPGSMP
jgi:hypothetical protein